MYVNHEHKRRNERCGLMHMHICYYSQQLTGKKAKVSNVKQQQQHKKGKKIEYYNPV